MTKTSKPMKKLIILLTVFILSCQTEVDTSNNEQRTIEWIKDAKKPIICERQDYKGGRYSGQYSYIKYTLIDADANVFSTGWVGLNLPNIIRIITNVR